MIAALECPSPTADVLMGQAVVVAFGFFTWAVFRVFRR